MTTLLGKYVGKWVLKLALAARNQAQAVISRFASDAEAHPDTAKQSSARIPLNTSQSGGPPAHWVQLVKHHAPELLQPGSLRLTPQDRAQIVDRHAGVNESPGERIKEPLSAQDTVEAENPEYPEAPISSNNLPRPLKASKGHLDPARQMQAPAQDHRQIHKDVSTEAAVRPSKHGLNVTEAQPLRPAQASNVDVQQSTIRWTGFEKKTRPWISGPDRNEVSGFIQGQGNKNREQETPAAQKYAAGRSPASAWQSEKKEIKQDSAADFKPIRRPGKTVDPGELQTGASQTGLSVHGERSSSEKVKPVDVPESRPRTGGFFKAASFAPDAQVQTSAFEIERRKDHIRPVRNIRILDEKSLPPIPAELNKTTKNPSLEFRWPSLPGEKVSEDDGDLHPTATWPSLPEEQSAGIIGASRRMEQYLPETGSRHTERLQRIDEEQRGAPWSALHF